MQAELTGEALIFPLEILASFKVRQAFSQGLVTSKLDAWLLSLSISALVELWQVCTLWTGRKTFNCSCLPPSRPWTQSAILAKPRFAFSRVLTKV